MDDEVRSHYEIPFSVELPAECVRLGWYMCCVGMAIVMARNSGSLVFH